MSAITHAITSANDDGRLALAVYLTAGFPTKATFVSTLRSLTQLVDVIEVGVPFSDPMADGVSIQHASFQALQQGVTLDWILECTEQIETSVPIVLMSYLNPLLAYGPARLADRARAGRVAGFIIPDLPFEESLLMDEHFAPRELDLIQMTTPATPSARMRRVCEVSRGFVYAVTSTGTTGGTVQNNESLPEYLDRVRSTSPIPVMAGFGIRAPEHIVRIAGHAHGVVVGSAIVEALDARDDVLRLVTALNEATRAHKEVSL